MQRASKTAELAVLSRASQARESGVLQGPDTVAVRFLNPVFRFVVTTEPVRRVVLSVMTRRMPGAYGYVFARSKAIDAAVRTELEEGATQLVVLGAGYDARAHRFAELIEGRGRVFEVDAPLTSERKQAKVRRAFGRLPKYVSYVSVDFDHQTMAEPLLSAGYDPNARTVFTWEGVSFYVSAEAVDRTLSFVAQQAPRGSAIVFDYIFRSILSGPSKLFGARETLRRVRRAGEPFTFGLDPSDVAAFLSARGLSLEENLLPPDLERRYLPNTIDRIHRVGAFYGLVQARVG